MSASVRSGSPLAALRRYAQPRTVEERCDLCGVTLAPAHRHLLELASRKILCSCDACAMRFQGVIDARFKRIPRDARPVPGMEISDAQWEGLALPISLAFFFFSTPAGKMTALYPSPAGATESLLPLETWSSLASTNPLLGTMEPDVEALLVNRVGEARDYFIAPIDLCFELAGLIRMHWRGLHGGDIVWQKIDQFFSRLRLQTAPTAEPIIPIAPTPPIQSPAPANGASVHA
jgi:hypothetical protein